MSESETGADGPEDSPDDASANGAAASGDTAAESDATDGGGDATAGGGTAPVAGAPDEEAAAAPPGAATVAPRRRLTRSRDDRVIAGVCGGLGEYFGVDTVLIRIAALILLFAGGAGFFLYIVGWIAMPEAPLGAGTSTGAEPAGERTGSAVALGLLFIGVGAFFLLDKAFPDLLDWRWMWPIALIAVGAIVIMRARR